MSRYADEVTNSLYNQAIAQLISLLTVRVEISGGSTQTGATNLEDQIAALADQLSPEEVRQELVALRPYLYSISPTEVARCDAVINDLAEAAKVEL